MGGPAYTLNVAGTELLLSLGARIYDDRGKLLAPIDVVLETDSRNPPATHRILELYVEHGLKLPDTPPMAVYRGRIDLLEQHLRRDPNLLQRTFTYDEIYPPDTRLPRKIRKPPTELRSPEQPSSTSAPTTTSSRSPAGSSTAA